MIELNQAVLELPDGADPDERLKLIEEVRQRGSPMQRIVVAAKLRATTLEAAELLGVDRRRVREIRQILQSGSLVNEVLTGVTSVRSAVRTANMDPALAPAATQPLMSKRSRQAITRLLDDVGHDVIALESFIDGHLDDPSEIERWTTSLNRVIRILTKLKKHIKGEVTIGDNSKRLKGQDQVQLSNRGAEGQPDSSS